MQVSVKGEGTGLEKRVPSERDSDRGRERGSRKLSYEGTRKTGVNQNGRENEGACNKCQNRRGSN